MRSVSVQGDWTIGKWCKGIPTAWSWCQGLSNHLGGIIIILLIFLLGRFVGLCGKNWGCLLKSISVQGDTKRLEKKEIPMYDPDVRIFSDPLASIWTRRICVLGRFWGPWGKTSGWVGHEVDLSAAVVGCEGVGVPQPPRSCSTTPAAHGVPYRPPSNQEQDGVQLERQLLGGYSDFSW